MRERDEVRPELKNLPLRHLLERIEGFLRKGFGEVKTEVNESRAVFTIDLSPDASRDWGLLKLYIYPNLKEELKASLRLSLQGGTDVMTLFELRNADLDRSSYFSRSREIKFFKANESGMGSFFSISKDGSIEMSLNPPTS